jgi:hypothetical protein
MDLMGMIEAYASPSLAFPPGVAPRLVPPCRGATLAKLAEMRR